jgi:hypothetical protein
MSKSLLQITFPFVSPGMNQRMRLDQKVSLKTSIRRVLADWVWDNGRPKLPEKVRVIYIRGYRSVPMDKDNLASSSKYFIDALVKYFNLGDDRHVDDGGCLDIRYHQEKGKPNTVIKIEYL